MRDVGYAGGMRDIVLDLLADDIEFTLEGVQIGRQRAFPNEELADAGFRRTRLIADFGVVGGNGSPSEKNLSFSSGDALDNILADFPRFFILREKSHTDSVSVGFGKFDTEVCGLAAEKGIWNLDQNACAVAGFRVTTRCTAMLQIMKNLKSHFDQTVRFPPFYMSDETDAAGVMFKTRVIQSPIVVPRA